MYAFKPFALIASTILLELACCISASPALEPNLLQQRDPHIAASPADGSKAGAALSSHAQSLVDRTVKQQQATGYKWDVLAAKALLTLVKDVETNGWQSKNCTLDNVYVRREWGSLSKKERKAYIKAVLCLQSRPSQLDPKQYPGAKNRYDDFVAVHISQTLTIHATGNFLTWHRYFTWAYEHTLRNECGYKGYQPYINWAIYAAHDPLKGPVFDGSDTSMSGDGSYVPHGDVNIPPPPLPPGTILPPQNGGGCIFSGPFVNWTVHLGPVSPVLNNTPPNPQQDGLGYNPRCLVRDISQYVSNRWTKDSDMYSVIADSADIHTFQTVLQGDPVNDNLGVHGGGHYIIGGDPGGDFYVSPGDPYFYLHHSAIDRTYWIWQNLSPQTRQYVIADTITFQNQPPSRNATLDDLLDMSVLNLAGVLKIRNAVSALGGSESPFCYIYE